MTIAFHGTRHPALPRHPGLCLVLGRNGQAAAQDYARAATERASERRVFEVDLDLDGLTVEEIEVDPRECWDRAEWPCDRAEDVAAMLARGVDAITFRDATETGCQHSTLRLLSERALAAIVAADLL